MSNELYALTPQAIDRLTALRLQVASIAAELGLTVEGSVSGRNYQTVLLSSGTANGDGTYNGNWSLSASGTFTNQTAIRILPATGATLVTGKQYLGYFSHWDNTNSKGVFIVPDAVGGAAGSATTYQRENAITPSETAGPVSSATVRVFHVSGLSLGDDGSANKGLMGLAASDTQQGMVTTTAQIFAGEKTFYANCHFADGTGMVFDRNAIDSGSFGVGSWLNFENLGGGESNEFSVSFSTAIGAVRLRHTHVDPVGPTTEVATLETSVVTDGTHTPYTDRIAMCNLSYSGVVRAAFGVNGYPGDSGSFTTADAKTVTVLGGIITSIV